MKLNLFLWSMLLISGPVWAAKDTGIQLRCHTEGAPHGYKLIVRPAGEDLQGMITLNGSISSASFSGKVELRLSEQNKRCAVDVVWPGDNAQALTGRVSFQMERKVNHIEELVFKGKDVLGKSDTPHPIECVPNKSFLEKYRELCPTESNASADHNESSPASPENDQHAPARPQSESTTTR